MSSKPKVIAIVGPTATGKSDLAVYIAQKIQGEIVSADSRQVYRGLDIGSGKITADEMRGIPHHLLDVFSPKKVYSVEHFKNDARKAIVAILKNKKVPIIAGGTGFYIDALISGEEFPAVPPNKKLRAQLEKMSTETLVKKIKLLDAQRASKLDLQNRVRIIRAIEIATALGYVPRVKKNKRYDTLFIGLTLDPHILREKIHTRLLKRNESNAMEKEVARLHKEGVSWKRLYSFGLEYRYVSLYLQKKMDKEEMLARLEQEIVHYAKRQMQWFRRNKNILWFAPGENKAIQEAVEKFLKN